MGGVWLANLGGLRMVEKLMPVIGFLLIVLTPFSPHLAFALLTTLTLIFDPDDIYAERRYGYAVQLDSFIEFLWAAYGWPLWSIYDWCSYAKTK